MGFFKKVKDRYRLWKKWHKLKVKDWPFLYIGPTRANWKLEHGTPLVRVKGPKGAVGGQRFCSPDGVTRVLHNSLVKER